MNILTVPEGKVAYTATNLRGFSDSKPATIEQLREAAAVMNDRAKELGIKTRYAAEIDATSSD